METVGYSLASLTREDVQIKWQNIDFQQISVWVYRLVPWGLLSRLWGAVAAVCLPRPLAALIVWMYSAMFGCRLDEAEHTSVWDYSSLEELFTRCLAPGTRPVSKTSRLVSPADGTLTFSEEYKGGRLQQVKGVYYSLAGFLGGNRKTQFRDDTMLYQVVVYLGPGDYHGFHSPATWHVDRRVHVAGELLSVAPRLLRTVPGLLHLNERVVLEGRWTHGYFAMVAVGATNVGSINIDFDPELVTNQGNVAVTDLKEYDQPVVVKKGERMGYFNFGSTIVLLFEAPKGLEFPKSDLTKVQYGQHLL